MGLWGHNLLILGAFEILEQAVHLSVRVPLIRVLVKLVHAWGARLFRLQEALAVGLDLAALVVVFLLGVPVDHIHRATALLHFLGFFQAFHRFEPLVRPGFDAALYQGLVDLGILLFRTIFDERILFHELIFLERKAGLSKSLDLACQIIFVFKGCVRVVVMVILLRNSRWRVPLLCLVLLFLIF